MPDKPAVPSDLEIARNAKMRPIAEIAERLGIPADKIHPYGHTKAKIGLDHVASLAGKPDGKLVLVTGISPTPAGEGKTTTTVGLGDALNRIGKTAMICLREPSLGPCFGMKGGAAGGGYAQVVPMEDINLHFTGDIHAISSAHNLMSAMIDNHIYWGNEPAIDPRRVTWRRVVDLNDRALRSIVNSLGGVANGFAREDGFDISVASEVMAIFCLTSSLKELQERLGRIVVAQTRARENVTAADVQASGPMAALLRDALMPNLVQTLENSPAFVHGGPFANIAHGCNSVMATRTALKLAQYTVTEAGFGADLGAEKFFDIKCRKAGLVPDATVIVATIRALKMHGGVKADALKTENVAALEAGFANLARHVENVRKFNVPVVVAINRFTSDTDAEVKRLLALGDSIGVEIVLCTHWADGSAGTEALAETVVKLAEGPREPFRMLYPDDMKLLDKIEVIAKEIYRAGEVAADARVRNQLKEYEDRGFGDFPVCIAKTQFSFSTDAGLRGAPDGHVVPIREVRLSGGAEFIVAICGDIMTMPGLPRRPAAYDIKVDETGGIVGLF